VEPCSGPAELRVRTIPPGLSRALRRAAETVKVLMLAGSGTTTSQRVSLSVRGVRRESGGHDIHHHGYASEGKVPAQVLPSTAAI